MAEEDRCDLCKALGWWVEATAACRGHLRKECEECEEGGGEEAR